MQSITRIPVEQVDDSIICTLKQSSVCCSQIMNFLLPLQETMPITRRLTDVEILNEDHLQYFSLALMSKEDIKKYIMKHPTRFTNIDYMNLFKITTRNRERDDAAIDWIEDILKASQKKQSMTKQRLCLIKTDYEDAKTIVGKQYVVSPPWTSIQAIP